jgi:hypothetical protein
VPALRRSDVSTVNLKPGNVPVPYAMPTARCSDLRSREEPGVSDVSEGLRMSKMTTIYYLAHALVIAIGVAITQIGGTIWVAIGTSLIATGGAGAVIYLYLAKTESARESLEMLSTFGISRVYDRRAAQIRAEYQSRLSKAQSNIDIIGFGLKDFRRDYLSELGTLASRAHVRMPSCSARWNPGRRDIG